MRELDLTDSKMLRDFLKRHNVWTKKKFGQNFLECRATLEKIVELGEIEKGKLIVEVGPGHGVLSRELLKNGAIVQAVEIDNTILGALADATREWKDYFSVENVHVLDFQIPTEKYSFIANIPYHLTSPILRKFLIESENRPEKMVMLVQKEVAEKICCKEGKDSLLSTLVKTFGKPTYALTVPAAKFFPAPKVDSAVMVIDTYPTPKISLEGKAKKMYFEMLFAGFKEQRKKFKNVLMKKFLKTEKEIFAIFDDLGIDHETRAQSITIEQWEKMTTIFFREWFEKQK